MSKKVIFRRAEVSAQTVVRLPRRPHAVLPCSQAFSEKRKWHQVSVGLHAYVSKDRLPLEQRLPLVYKKTFVDMTYLKGWIGSLPRRPLIFSWKYFEKVVSSKIEFLFPEYLP